MRINQPLLLLGTALSGSAFNAHATLTSYSVNGTDLVYSSVSDVTWTKDANLLGTLESTQGFNTIVNAIIAASPVIHDHFIGTYALSTSDFNSGGSVNWYGAQAFVGYLNSVNYGGSNQWALPTTPDSINSLGYNQTNSQLGDLYYNELNKLAYPGTNGSDWGLFGNGNAAYGASGIVGPFSNAKAYAYWSGTEYSVIQSGGQGQFPADWLNSIGTAWSFGTYEGNQGYSGKFDLMYAWAVSPGQIVATPIPAAAWLFGPALLTLFGFNKRVGGSQA